MKLQDFLDAIDYRLIFDDQSEEYERDNWSVYYQNYKSPFEWDKTYFRDIYAYWGGVIILQFDGEEESKPLKMVTVKEGYEGKYNNLIGVGGSICDLLHYYDFLFDQDCFYLASKKEFEYDIEESLEDIDYDEKFTEIHKLNNNGCWENRNLVEGLLLITNYRLDYSSTTNDHIIESLTVFKVL